MLRTLACLILLGGTFACGQQKRVDRGPGPLSLSAQDVTMARSVIAKNTMSLPGLTPGSRFQLGPGSFSPADALVLYVLKFHSQTGLCIPEAALRQALDKVNDAELHKSAASKFWNQYCATKDIASYAQKPGGLQNGFEWYITYKSAARTKRSNAALEAQVRSEEAWRRAMDSDRKTREKTARAEERNRTARESYLRQWNAEAAVAAAEAAVASQR